MKRALSVGINYTGTGNDLKGCLNDSAHMKHYLEGKGFEVKLVLEKEATTAGIIAALNWLVEGTVPGDIIVFHYSGHGSQLPSRHEADGFEEIICPIDLNWRDKVITDDTLREIFDKVPHGVNITLFLDCCHSGTMLDQTESTASATRALVTDDKTKSRKIKKKGDRFLKPPASVLKKLKDRHLVEWSTTRDVNATAMLIAACQENQTSADTVINGIPQGAGTASLLEAVNADGAITYKQLVDKMNGYMVANKYTQRPVLDGSFGLHNEVFLSPWSMFVPAPVAEEPVLVVEELVEEEESEKDNKLPIFVAIVCALVLLVMVALS